MESCTEQMLEMEQTDEVYRLGRALRSTYPASALDPAEDASRALMTRLDALEDEPVPPSA